MFAKLISPLVILNVLAVSGCTNAVPEPPAPFSGLESLPPIRTTLSCLPPSAALVAAHRATSESFNEPENSLSSLERLIDGGIMMAEVDIASISDGTPILFHDGVWDEHASATGPVVTTTPQAFSRLRLREKDGRIGGEPVPKLADLLDKAKDRIYLELDLKSSANLDRVIELVRERDMADQVLLIASSDEESELFQERYGNEFFLSLPRAPRRGVGPRQGVWIGDGWQTGDEDQIPQRHYVIGAQWQKQPSQLAKAADALDILVTRQAHRYSGVVGLEKGAAFRTCLQAADLGTEASGPDASADGS